MQSWYSMTPKHHLSYDALASTHGGGHTVKITDAGSNAIVRTLFGHPRTPWTVKFHPNDPHILASGCLGFQVRVWDLRRRAKAKVAAHGMGGLGKTMLVACVVRDPTTHGAICPDGAVWIQFSQDTKPLAGLHQCIRLLEALFDVHPDKRCEDEHMKTISDAQRQLATLLDRRRVLIVADDVATAYAQSANDASDDIGDARAISRSNDCT